MSESLLKVADGIVVSMHYVLHVNGDLVDSSKEGRPLEFIQGMGHIVAGLEHELYGMQSGDQKSVSVAAKDAYGEVDAAAFMDVPRTAFPPDVPLEAGTQLELRDKSGHPAYARVESLTAESIRLNMNHPLAGKVLEFDVRIDALRLATPDETAHGHVHGTANADLA
jgi:FKBP-type peptidyl-prolyl cis-trans isomerase SlyD